MSIQNQTKIFNVYIDNLKSENNPIEWMIMKEKISNKFLLRIPYSPLIETNDFKSATLQHKVFLDTTPQQNILDSIKILYKSNEIIFSPKFLQEIRTYKNNEDKIKLNFQYDIGNKFNYSHLYFLNGLTTMGPFSVEFIDTKNMMLETNKKTILTKVFPERLHKNESNILKENSSDILKEFKKRPLDFDEQENISHKRRNRLFRMHSL